MSNFQSLAEFEALKDQEKIDLGIAETMLDRLCVTRLTAVLTRFTWLRKCYIRRWVNEIKKISGRDVKLHLTCEEITPYMLEEGVICFSKKDVYRVKKLLMLLAHETAHFVLMRDPNYEMIKQIDCEYKAMPWREQTMHSPVEYCANLVTIMILTRCQLVEKDQNKKEIIQDCVISLNKQLTK